MVTGLAQPGSSRLPALGTIAVGAAARIGGAALAGATSAIAHLRPAAKPLHPRGQVWTAKLTRHGLTEPMGVPWLDESGIDQALVRLSAAVGLPDGWPDFKGIAIRTRVPDGQADLLLATTGAGAMTRFMLAPARSATGHVHTCLLPYRGPDGPVMLAAVPADEGRFTLLCATLTGPWQTFGDLELFEPQPGNPSFDPIEQASLPGLDHYNWVRRLRAPAYRTAREERDAHDLPGEAGYR